MVLLWAIAGTVAAGALCLRVLYWQSKAEAVRIVRAIEAGDTEPPVNQDV